MHPLDVISEAIISCSMEVHSAVGSGALERTYRLCTAYELRLRGFIVECEKPLPLKYKNLVVDSAYRIDLLVNDAVIVEIKAVDRILPVHHAQVISYLKSTGKHLGLLINFNVPHLRNGIKRFVNNFPY